MSDLGLALLVRAKVDDEEAARCYYCGLAADSVDHVIPRSVLQQMADDPEALEALTARRRLTVLCCRECNVFASATTQESLNERRAYIHEKLSRRYRRFLEMPDWSDSEIMELGPELRRGVLTALGVREIMRRRLRWPY